MLQQAYMQRAVLHKDDPAKAEADANAAAAYGNRLARMMTADVRMSARTACLLLFVAGVVSGGASLH